MPLLSPKIPLYPLKLPALLSTKHDWDSILSLPPSWDPILYFFSSPARLLPLPSPQHIDILKPNFSLHLLPTCIFPQIKSIFSLQISTFPSPFFQEYPSSSNSQYCSHHITISIIIYTQLCQRNHQGTKVTNLRFLLVKD